MQSIVALLSLSALAAAVPTPEAEPIYIDLPERRSIKRADGTVDLLGLFNGLNSTLVKYGAAPLAPISGLDQSALSGLLKRQNANEALTDQVTDGEDELYYGTGQVGSQSFTFDFDTGSSDIFVPGPQCGTSQGCVGTTKYNQQGTDRHTTTSITYGSGQVTGEDYFDSVTVVGLKATKQNVISLTSAQGFSNSASEGLLGMGFTSIAASKQTTYFENLIAQGTVTNREFSFYLGRAASNTQGNSQLTLGGRNSAKYTGATTTVPVAKQGYWLVNIDGSSANGKQSAAGKGQAAIDTGTTLVIGPNADVAALFANIPGSIPIPMSGTTLYAYPCNSKPNAALTFAGKSFAINNLDFNFGQLVAPLLPFLGGLNLPASLLSLIIDGACIAGVAGADLQTSQSSSPIWIVGDTFIKNWYSTFSYDNGASVQFAKSV